MTPIPYALEQLFIDQDHDWVVDTIAAVLACVPGTSKPGKAPTLLARPDLAEVHLSLWCATPRISIMEQLKP